MFYTKCQEQNKRKTLCRLITHCKKCKMRLLFSREATILFHKNCPMKEEWWLPNPREWTDRIQRLEVRRPKTPFMRNPNVLMLGEDDVFEET